MQNILYALFTIKIKNNINEDVKMRNINIFKNELEIISDIELKDVVVKVLNDIPEYFYSVPASSTGKYHPRLSLGDGGLVRHVKTGIKIGLDLLRCEQFVADNNYNRDIVIVALMLHDSFKSGVNKQDFTVSEHPLLTCEFIKNINVDNNDLREKLFIIAECIESHMGIWNKDRDGNEILPKPNTELQKLVHLADYMASRKYIDYNELYS